MEKSCLTERRSWRIGKLAFPLGDESNTPLCAARRAGNRKGCHNGIEIVGGCRIGRFS